MTLHRWILFAALTVLVGTAACEAGPSAFDRSRGAAAPGPEDTADAAALPEIPTAADVEHVVEEVVAEAPEVDTVSTEQEADSVPTAVESDSEAQAPRFPQPENIRGLYVNAWGSGSRRRMDAILELARRTEINSLVIDIKDATGYVSHRTNVPLAKEIGATEEIRIRDLSGLLDRFEAEGIYPIARIVIVKDPLLAAAYPETAVQDTAGGVLVDGKGIIWLNPYNRMVWDYHVELAREVAEMGFPEIQWDYVRFPDIPQSVKDRAVYPGAGDTPPPEAIRNLLAYSREALAEVGAEVTADVFGVTTSARRDVGIGQVWEPIIGAVDAALPMVYPSHYWEGSFGLETPNAYPYEVVKRALQDALERSAEVEGAGETRPWLQDFTLGAPRYEAPEVRAQIQATYDAGIQDWILWNPGSRYTEDALEPVGGFVEEPLIRVADEIVPVSRRFELLEPPTPPEPAPDSVPADTAADTTEVDAAAMPPDTVPASPTGTW